MAHASRSLLTSEKQYSQIEKEALGIIFAVTKFHRYLHGRWLILQTDHKPLITIFGSKKDLPVYTANRLLRWRTILLNYNFKIEFLTSKNICHVDSLSRLIPKNSEVFEDSIIATLWTDWEIKNMIANPVKKLPVTLADIKKGVSLKRALKNALGTSTDRALQQFLQVYRITPNPNTPMGRSPAETMFARKVKSVFDKLIPQQAKFKKTVSPHKKHFYPDDKVLFKAYKNNMTFWEVGTIKQRIGELVYIVQWPQKKHPTNAIWTSSGNTVWINRKNHHKISAKNRSMQYSIISIFDSPQVSPKYATLGKKKKIYATTRCKSQEAEV